MYRWPFYRPLARPGRHEILMTYDLRCSAPSFGDFMQFALVARLYQLRGIRTRIVVIDGELRDDSRRVAGRTSSPTTSHGPSSIPRSRKAVSLGRDGRSRADALRRVRGEGGRDRQGKGPLPLAARPAWAARRLRTIVGRARARAAAKLGRSTAALRPHGGGGGHEPRAQSAGRGLPHRRGSRRIGPRWPRPRYHTRRSWRAGWSGSGLISRLSRSGSCPMRRARKPSARGGWTSVCATPRILAAASPPTRSLRSVRAATSSSEAEVSRRASCGEPPRSS